ncbi:hypothetical protein AAG906_039911 [Vitis piasezkii]
MATENFAQPTVPRFDGYYDHWAMLMENFLHSKEYWSIVENGILLIAKGSTPTQAQRKEVEEARLKDMKIKNYCFNRLTGPLWRQFLTRTQQRMKEGEKVDEYFARALTIANKMKAHEERMGQNVIVEKILRSMTPRFDYVVCSIEESNNVDTMTIDELQSSLLVHEQRMNCHSGNARDEQALKVSYGERYEGRGHFQYECPSWEKSANYVEFDEEEEMLLMSYVEWFSNIDEAFRHLVKLDNNKRMRVMGKGNIRLEINGSTQTKMTTNRMFVLLANVVLETSTCLQTVTEDNSKLWHRRFGHLSYKGLRTLQYKEMVKGLPLLRASTIACNECFVGKQHRNVIPKKNSVEGEDAFSESEEEVVEGIEAVVTDQEVEATTPTSIESSNEVAPVQAETRIRRAPPYFNLAIFISHEDPGSLKKLRGYEMEKGHGLGN